MKRTLLAVGVLTALACSGIAYAYVGLEHQESKKSVALAAHETSTSSTDAASAEEKPGYGVSIGTVEAQLYSESGLDLQDFSSAQYVARTSEGTYMGFALLTLQEYDNTSGGYRDVEWMGLSAISSTDRAVTIPDTIMVGQQKYPISIIYDEYLLASGFRNSNIKTLTVPKTVALVQSYSSFDKELDAIYMLGSVPVFRSSLSVPRVYVCDKSCWEGYTGNERLSASNIIPFGWDFEWITVNVEKKGEFADTYLTQNNNSWSAGVNVKVTGDLNDNDLNAIKLLTSLAKLDLSECSISRLPDSFLLGCTTLREVKLPPTLETISNYAFSGCTGLESVEANGVRYIGEGAFYRCWSLPSVNLTGVETIGNSAFNYCITLNNVDLSTVRSIGDGSFGECTSLKSIIFGGELKEIPSSCFYSTAVESVVIPYGLTSLGFSAFGDCKQLAHVELPSTLKVISSNVFKGCSALSEITIPSKVESIGSGAFDNTGIKTFRCYAAVPPSTTGQFIGTGMNMADVYLYVPPFSKDFYRNTENWNSFYIMRSIEDPIDYIYVDRLLSINLEEEDNAVVANNPEMFLNYRYSNSRDWSVGQLTATGEGTLSAGQMMINALLGNRYNYESSSANGSTLCPTLINYADKMRADNVTISISMNPVVAYSGEWHFISLPFDVKVSDIVPGDNTYWVVRRYDSAARAEGEMSSTWVNLTADDTMEAGKGYIVSAAYGGTGSFFPRLSFSSGNSLTKNNLFRSTDVIVPLEEYPAEFAHNRSWNLIGNPYPCYFDMHYLNEDFTAPVTIWNGVNYVAYSPVDDNLVLAPYEAFFVQCPLNATEMTFKEAGRLHSDEGMSQYKMPEKTVADLSAEGRNVFNFELTGEKSSDRARIVLNPEAEAGYEIGRDASKFFADKSDFAQLYVAGDVEYSICERPVGEGAATLGIRGAEEATYTLSLSGRYSSEWHVIVTDKVTGTSADLTEQDYQFVGGKGDASDRFSVRFQLGNQSEVHSVMEEFGNDAEVTVTAVNGTVAYKGRLSEMNVPSAGIYVISNGEVSFKTILK